MHTRTPDRFTDRLMQPAQRNRKLSPLGFEGDQTNLSLRCIGCLPHNRLVRYFTHIFAGFPPCCSPLAKGKVTIASHSPFWKWEVKAPTNPPRNNTPQGSIGRALKLIDTAATHISKLRWSDADRRKKPAGSMTAQSNNGCNAAYGNMVLS